MSAQVIPLVLHRTIKPAKDCYRVEAGTEGNVYLTVVDGAGQETTLILPPADCAALRLDLEDAESMAEELTRG